MKLFIIILTAFNLTFSNMIFAKTVETMTKQITTEHSETANVFLQVNGLVCDFCARALEKVFKREPAIKNIDVDLDEKIIRIYFQENKKLPEEKIKTMILDSGYHVETIRYAK